MSTRAQTAHLKKAFLEFFAEHGNVSTAATLAGVHRRRVYEWQEHDEAFAAAYREAEIIATEVLEREARRRAVEGVVQETPIYARGFKVGTVVKTEYSDTLLIFLLKARAPEKYRDRLDVRHDVAAVREAAERVAAREGLDPSEVMAEALALLGIER